MRTTVRLDDALLEQAKRETARRNQTLTALIEQGLRFRIATHPRIYRLPSRIDQATSFASLLIDQPHCQIVLPGARHWSIFLKLCGAANAVGNLVQDAWFAALAVESGCEWITIDRDFARFPGLRWRPPF